MSNNNTRYSNQLYSHKDITVNDVISEKNQKVHKMLYEDALNELKKFEALSETYYTFTEIQDKQHFSNPSKVIVRNKKYPFKSKIYDLKNYWKEYKFEQEYNASNIPVDESSLSAVNEVIYKDYAKGIAILKNKMSGNVITTDLYNIDDSVPYSTQIQLNDTFSYLTKQNFEFL